MKNAAFPIPVFSMLYFIKALCCTTLSVPLSSSVFTWHLHQLPNLLPLLCPLSARNKNICSVKCFCKQPYGLRRCRATEVQMDWFQFCHLISHTKEKRHHLAFCTWRLGETGPGVIIQTKQWPHGMQCLPSEPLSSAALCLYRSCMDVWLHQLSWDKAHETFLTFLKCVANQEWLLMWGGFSK